MSQAPLLVDSRPQLALDGRRAERLEADLIRLETHADSSGLARLEAVFLNWDSKEPGGAVDFVHFDRQEVDFGRQLRVSFAVEQQPRVVFEGLVSGMGADFPELRPPEFTLLAEDRLLGLQLRERTRLSEASSDAAIVARIAGDAGFSAQVEGGDGRRHRQLLQLNQSDLDALRQRLPDHLIRFSEGQLKVSTAASEAEPPLQLTRQNQLLRFTVLADLAQQRGEVRVHGWDVAAKEAIHATAGAAVVRAEAPRGRLGAEVVAEVFNGAAEDLHLEAPVTADEARQRAEARMRQRSRRFVRGRGVTLGTPALRVGSRLELVDLGPWFRGIFLVTAVSHCFDQANGYRTHFEAQRAHLEESP
jgi:phage protein D